MIVDNLEALAEKGYEAPGTPRSSTDGVTEFASGSLDLEVHPAPHVLLKIGAVPQAAGARDGCPAPCTGWLSRIGAMALRVSTGPWTSAQSIPHLDK